MIAPESKAKPFESRLRRGAISLPQVAFLIASLSIVGMLAALSIARYRGYNTGMLDLGNMAQAIGSVRRGEPLIFTFTDGATSRLALHVEFIYLLLAPWYALWPDPRFLLLFQSGLFGLGAVPVYRLARRNLGSVFAAGCLSLIYLLYPTAQTSVLFDFHGDTLAMPLLLFAFDALDCRARWRYWLFLALALLCKFYVASVVVLLGPVIWWRYQDRRLAVATTLIGFAYGVIAFGLIRPLFTTAQTSAEHRGLNYLSFYFGNLAELASSWDQRLISAVVVLGPLVLLLRHGWRWLLPALPLIGAALLSTGPGGAYDYRYHHYAIAVPFLMMAAIEGTRYRMQASRLRQSSSAVASRPRRRGRSWQGDLGLTVAIVLIFNVAFVDTPLNPLFWMGLPGQGLDAAVYGRTERDALKDRWLAAHVPAEAPIAASNFLASHLTNRDTLYLVRYPDEPRAARLARHLAAVDVAIPDALFDFVMPLDGGFAGGIAYDVDAIRQLMQASDWGLTAARDGLLRFDRAPAPEAVLPQSINLIPSDEAAKARFGDRIELLHGSVEPLDGRRYRATFRWRATRDFAADEHLIAVSALDGLAHARIVHLPSYAVQPTSGWMAGEVREERFDLVFPDEIALGAYTWRVAWYDTRSAYAAQTDERSRVGDAVAVTEVVVR